MRRASRGTSASSSADTSLWRVNVGDAWTAGAEADGVGAVDVGAGVAIGVAGWARVGGGATATDGGVEVLVGFSERRRRRTAGEKWHACARRRLLQ
ncbi:hypothetical protein ANO14919_133140 [Xylariales sp. No.14919]|nr:hypothetical protein ANO14919_133140 [Xylariales sp. No.14919]